MIEKIAKFKNLKAREKALILSLGVVLLFSLYFKLVHKPLSRSIKKYKFQIEKEKARLNELQAKSPAVGKQKESIKALQVNTEKMKAQIAKIEKELPGKANTSGLLTEIMRQTKGLELAAASQKLKDYDNYSQILIELRFNAGYKDTIDFINRVEAISPFLIVEEMEISEPTKKEPKPTPGVRVLFTSILGKGLAGSAAGADFKPAQKMPEPLKIKRDIFMSKKKPAAQIRKVDLKLEGITFRSKEPTAILNGEVVRINSEVKGYTVKEILLNSIVVSDGTSDHVLAIER